jgi:hypothetical protein
VKEFRDRLVRLEDADEIELVFLEMEEYYSIAV